MFKEEKTTELIKNEAAKFLQMESNRTSLITVTNAVLSKDGKRAKILFTVLPEDHEKDALDFAKRKRSDFQEYMRKKTRIARMPLFDFDIDKGEKARQKIDALSQELNK